MLLIFGQESSFESFIFFVSSILFIITFGILLLFFCVNKLPKERLVKLSNYRWIFYLSAFVIAFIEYLPILFFTKFHSAKNVNQFVSFVVFFVLYGIILFAIIFNWIAIRKKTYKLWYLTDIFVIPFALIFLVLLLSPTLSKLRNNALVRINQDKRVEEFVNPFIGIAMNDCRKFTDEYDVIFVPASLSIERDFLFYRNNKSDAESKSIYFKEYRRDWHLAKSGSQWSESLRTCAWQGRDPF